MVTRLNFYFYNAKGNPKMLRYIIAALLAMQLTLSAELDIKNEQDRAIFKEAYSLASIILSQDSKSRSGSNILKFAAWMNPQHTGVKEMRGKAVFGEKVSAHGTGSAVKLARMLVDRQKKISDLNTRILYVIIATTVDPTNNEAVGELKTMKDSGYDTNLSKLLKECKKPELIDLVAAAKIAAEQNKKMEKENKELKSVYKPERANKMSVVEIEKLLDLIKFKSFNYSEASILDAINRITHKLYWRGVQVTLSGNRVSYTDIKTASNGAIFYVGPLYEPKSEEYKLKDSTLREILSHFNINMNLAYTLREGEIALSDSEIPEFSDIPEEGLAANNLRQQMRNFSIADIKKYRGKSFKMNGIITGIGRGMDSRRIYFSLDGGMTQLHVDKVKLDAAVLKRLDTKVDAFKKNGGLKKYRDKLRESQKTGEEINRMSIVDKMQYITFKATCTGIDKDRLVFNNPEWIAFESSGEFLLAPSEKKN